MQPACTAACLSAERLTGFALLPWQAVGELMHKWDAAVSRLGRLLVAQVSAGGLGACFFCWHNQLRRT